MISLLLCLCMVFSLLPTVVLAEGESVESNQPSGEVCPGVTWEYDTESKTLTVRGSGLITLEDILEEIVGEIHDEYDENEEENIKAVGKHEYIIEGSTNLDDLNDSLDLNLESEDYDSLGGFIIEKLDRLPKAGDSVSTEDGIRMVVEKLDKNRIETVHLYLPESYREHTSDSLETDD